MFFVLKGNNRWPWSWLYRWAAFQVCTKGSSRWPHSMTMTAMAEPKQCTHSFPGDKDESEIRVQGWMDRTGGWTAVSYNDTEGTQVKPRLACWGGGGCGASHRIGEPLLRSTVMGGWRWGGGRLGNRQNPDLWILGSRSHDSSLQQECSGLGFVAGS